MNVPCSHLVLSINCFDLPNLDGFSKSDPFVVVFENGKEIGRTERIKNNQNPKFVEKIKIDYFFEKAQPLSFNVYDSDDSKHSDLSNHQFIGEAKANLSEIASSKDGWRKTLSNSKGSIQVISEEIAGKPFTLDLHLAGIELDKKDLFGKSDPYLVFYRELHGGHKTKIYETEVVKNTLNLTWNKFHIDSSSFANNMDADILIECYDWDSNSEHDLIGSTRVSFKKLIEKQDHELVNPKKTGKKDYRHSGLLRVLSHKLEPHFSFLDYLYGGCEISLMVAIDFTGSNGDPASSDSLHYRNPSKLNEYQQAILSVGSVVEPYDADRLFPVFGFGGKLGDGKVYHDFNCNLNPNDPNVLGVQGIMSAYEQSISYVQLWGPTNFCPVIKKVTSIIKAIPAQLQKYFILLILTDGEITDMSETVNAIVEASNLPLSIIIIGVGDADFSSMEKLDGDKKGLKSSHGVKASRDIVQFVPFRKPQRTQENLAQEVLNEVPKQLLSYMKTQGLKPLRS